MTSLSLLLAGVAQVVEIDVLAVAVNPRRDEAESVKRGARRLVAWGQVQAHGVAIKRYRDPPVAAGARRVIIDDLEKASIAAQSRFGAPTRGCQQDSQ